MDREERLQKIISAAGIVSRRKAEDLIRQGRVTVNGKVVMELGSKAVPGRDHIKVDGKLISEFPTKVYILLNKPRQVMSTISDPQGRTKVTDLLNLHEKVYPVGRLDFNTEGLILLTNDGDFARIVASAGDHLPKVYHVKVRSVPDDKALNCLREGANLHGGVRLAPCKIRPLKEGSNAWFEVTLTQGRNRQIREMFRAVGNPVLKLRRTRIGFLNDRGLAPGRYRSLTEEEVERILKMGKPASSKGEGRVKAAFRFTQ